METIWEDAQTDSACQLERQRYSFVTWNLLLQISTGTVSKYGWNNATIYEFDAAQPPQTPQEAQK